VRRRTHLAVFLLWLGLVAVYTWPLARDPAHLWPDNHDPRLFTWVMLTIFRNLTTQPTALFHGNTFYPVGQSLTFAEPLLTPALMAGPLHGLTGNPVLAYNLTLLAFWALSGWAMHAVAFRLTRSHLAAFVAAAVFTLAPYRTQLFLEFQMQIAFGIPLGVYTFVRFLETQRRRDLVAFLAVFWLQAIAVWYYAIALALGLAVVAVQYVALRWGEWRPRALGEAAAGGLVLAGAVLPVAWPFFVTRRELGYERGLREVGERAAEVLTYLELQPNWLYHARPAGYIFETSNFPGVVALALAAVGLAWLAGRQLPAGAIERWLARAAWLGAGVAVLALAVRRGVPFTAPAVAALGLGLARHAVEGARRWRLGLTARELGPREWSMLLLGFAAVAFLLSLGPVVRVAGQVVDTGLYAWLYPYLVPLRAIRAVTRIGVLVLFVVALLAALGAAWLSARLPRAGRGLVAVAAVLLLLESATFPLPYESVALARPVDAFLGGIEPEAVVLEWPVGVPVSDSDAMFRSVSHGRRVVNGYSGFVPLLHRELSGLLTTAGPVFPVPEAQAALRRIYPLRYLVVRLDDPAITPRWQPAWRGLRVATPPVLRFRGSFGASDVYDVVPLPERGTRIERWVAYDLLRSRPVLDLGVAPLAGGAGLDQRVEVLLNGRLAGTVPLNGPQRATLALAPPFHRAAPNEIVLRHAYQRPPGALDAAYEIGRTGRRSPADIQVRSGGQPWGNRASIEVNGVEHARNQRGYNLVALEPAGRVLDARVFDTFAEAAASTRLARWVAGLPPGTIVAGAVKDEGSGWLDATAVGGLAALGVAGDLRGRYRESHAFVGVKGAPPASAVEALGPRRVDLEVGRVAVGLGLELTEFALAAGQSSR
jgi:hypothetical protein